MVAQFLESHPSVKRVLYPHLKAHPQYEIAKKQMEQGGNMLAFEIDGDNIFNNNESIKNNWLKNITLVPQEIFLYDSTARL